MKKIVLMMSVLALVSLTLAGYAETMQVVGTEYPPFTYTNADDGTLEGFAFELVQLMLDDLELDATFAIYPWKRAELMLTEEPNTLAFLTRTPGREALYHWVGPVYPRTISLFRLKTRPEVRLTRVADAEAYKIGVVRGYASIQEIIDAGVSPARLEEIADDALNIRKLFEEHIDLIPGNELVVASLLRQEGHTFDDVETAFVVTPEGQSYFYFGLSKMTDEQLVRQFQQAFQTLRDDGRYERLLQQYLQ